MIMSSYERVYFDAWRGYVGVELATKMLYRMRDEMGVDKSFGIIRPKYVNGVMQDLKAPAWADELRRGFVPMMANSEWKKGGVRKGK